MTAIENSNLCAKRLADSLGKKFGNCLKRKGRENVYKIGCWSVDHNPTYGGSVIEEIHNKYGGINHPFGSRKRKSRDFCDTIHFALKAIELDRKKKKGK